MTTVVKRDEVITAKRKISDLIHSRQRGVILSGPLLKLEEDKQEKSWIVRKAALLDEKLDMHDHDTNAKVEELSVLGNQVNCRPLSFVDMYPQILSHPLIHVVNKLSIVVNLHKTAENVGWLCIFSA